LAVTFAQAGDVAVGVVGHLFEVGGRGGTGGDFVRIQGFQFPVVTVVLIGGQLVFGILDGERQAVVAVGVGRIILCQRTTHGFFDDLDTVVAVVDGLGDAVAAVDRGGARPPGFQQFTARSVAVAGYQPLGTDLRGAADQTAVGVAIDAPDDSILTAHVIGLWVPSDFATS